jgi:Meiotically up-regulated gene 113
MKVGGVYVVGFSEYVKIGCTDDFERRLKAVQDSAPEILTVYGLIPAGTFDVETALHHRFKSYRLHREWFRKAGELAAWIAEGCPSPAPEETEKFLRSLDEEIAKPRAKALRPNPPISTPRLRGLMDIWANPNNRGKECEMLNDWLKAA